ncbi:MAG: LegC family aminotransferase [Chitinophagaceae bacterium]
MSNNKFIPLSVPNIAGNEWTYVKECLDTGWISSVGSYVTKFEEAVAAYTNAKFGIAVVNGTCALHLCLQMYGVQRGDYVIMPNITFIATANSITYLGAEPILIDTHPNTWQMDLDVLEDFLATKTEQKNGELFYNENGRRIKLVVPVHVQGNLFDMDRFIAICNKYGIEFFEDSTEALGTTYNGTHAGRFGKMGIYSFNGNKIISTGGGGMIVTDDEALAKKAKHLSTQAKSDPFEYIHDEVGYNYRLVNILAAVGLAQMEQLPSFINRKREIVSYYKQQLTGVGDIQFQEISEGVNDNGWLFTVKTNKQKELLKHLNDQQIQSRPFWAPMNLLPMYKDCVYHTHNDNSQKVYTTCLSIPSSTNISNQDLEVVASAIKTFYQQ